MTLPSIASQEDAVIVQRMAQQALEDGPTLEVLIDAGCSLEEAAAVLNSEVN